MSSKRARPSTPEAQATTKVEGLSPKVKRTSISSSAAPISCTLPPTCNAPNPPSLLASSKEFEQHYATYHTHICTAPEVKRNPGSSREAPCGKVFPDARLLDLHFAECHDPLIAVRQDRGEKTFSCFLGSCDGIFQTPKGRRLHLIDVHGYPKEYYFSVTTNGVGDILNKWGQGASLLRKEWKPREPKEAQSGHQRSESMEVDFKAATTNSNPSSPDQTMITRDSPPHLKSPASPSRRSEPSKQLSDQKAPAWPIMAKEKAEAAPNDLDALTSGLSSLSLVPSSIRFGRGRGGALLGRGSGPPPKTAPVNEDPAAPSSPPKMLGGGRKPNRGRGGSFGVVARAADG
ncbi:hypothetical protein FRB93_011006 [Tulasnella sp. JGI-2019a]|nr:hypothetical protein FRB93_011006 [Tulasnella sp. JGI-2019a]